MNLLSRLNKPEYFYRPVQVLNAVRSRALTPIAEAIVTLPWGLRLAVNPAEAIGRAILRLGVYDLCVSESICRLLDPGESAIDVGANLGYMTSLMAAKVGKSGSVESFEPHPDLYAKLSRNADRWRVDGVERTVSMSAVALSSHDGFATLRVPDEGFRDNEGLASLERYKEAKGIVVPTRRLDAAVVAKQISLIKIDVEGHELAVLLGAGALVTSRQIRDIIFEEEATYPTPTTEYLEQQGYKIYGLGMKFRGPIIADQSMINRVPRRAWEPKSLLATCAEDRAESRFRPRGWSVLRPIHQPSRANNFSGPRAAGS
jgi:FkbM family methyltransferase